LDQDGILLIDYLSKGQIINVECYSSLLVQLQLKGILTKNAAGRSQSPVLARQRPAHRALATQKKLAYLGFPFLITDPILRIWPHLTTTCSLD
jgi:hypothetical protein